MKVRRSPTLAGRMVLILLATTIAMQLLSFAVMASGAWSMRDKLYDFLAADTAFIHRFLAQQQPQARRQWLPALGRGELYGIDILPLAELPAPVALHELARLMSGLQQQLARQGQAPSSHLILRGQAPAIVVPLDAREALLVTLPPQPPLSPPPIYIIALYLLLLSLCIMAVALYAVRQLTRPLQRFTQAAQALASNLDAPPLACCGPAEVQQASAAFNAMQAALQKNLAERTRILASISHDLKTPLTRLRLRLDQLPAAERQAAGQDIDGMLALIQEGLDYAHSEHVQEAQVATDLNALIDTLIEQAEDLGHAVSLQGRLPEPVRCAPRATRRALQNLLDNALAHGREAGIVLSQDASGSHICIQDRGPGLPPHELARVFAPFYRVEASRNRASGGSGLGLTIARNLLQGQGAQLQLRNRTGGGLQAWVRFAAH
ncbi:two-component sensor histidine kinase [Vandammella animalimorsus]|uniref:histidine kinase n=1 Tax=Vandammella animalimorsus TaxID=2029117 RepID=A0A2A2AN32_9BURK|nr:ATP-binding protein [Vandammella animalimorsus]PAT39122.1 two-component sensor histidine kinase [Vandammella animalimorsus]